MVHCWFQKSINNPAWCKRLSIDGLRIKNLFWRLMVWEIKSFGELFDIWNYRAQLAESIKHLISPPNGRPFSNLNITNLQHKTDWLAKKHVLYIIENFILKSPNSEYQALGAFYVLGALTLVSNRAALAGVWGDNEICWTASWICRSPCWVMRSAWVICSFCRFNSCKNTPGWIHAQP